MVGTVTASETVTSSVPVATEVSQSIKVVPSTTLVVLAPTGVVRADGADGGSLYVGDPVNAGPPVLYNKIPFLGLEDSRSSAGKVFLVRDPSAPSTGNYGVAFSLQPSTYWVSVEQLQFSDRILCSDPFSYALWVQYLLFSSRSSVLCHLRVGCSRLPSSTQASGTQVTLLMHYSIRPQCTTIFD